MKIEIELEAVESLKKTIEFQDKKIESLEYQLREQLEKKLEDKAIRLAEKLFVKYNAAILTKLGFKESYRSIRGEDVHNWVRKKWENDNEKITVELSADLYKDYMYAFLSIGVNENRFIEPESLLAEI